MSRSWQGNESLKRQQVLACHDLTGAWQSVQFCNARCFECRWPQGSRPLKYDKLGARAGSRVAACSVVTLAASVMRVLVGGNGWRSHS